MIKAALLRGKRCFPLRENDPPGGLTKGTARRYNKAVKQDTKGYGERI